MCLKNDAGQGLHRWKVSGCCPVQRLSWEYTDSFTAQLRYAWHGAGRGQSLLSTIVFLLPHPTLRTTPLQLPPVQSMQAASVRSWDTLDTNIGFVANTLIGKSQTIVSTSTWAGPCQTTPLVSAGLAPEGATSRGSTVLDVTNSKWSRQRRDTAGTHRHTCRQLYSSDDINWRQTANNNYIQPNPSNTETYTHRQAFKQRFNVQLQLMINTNYHIFLEWSKQ